MNETAVERRVADYFKDLCKHSWNGWHLDSLFVGYFVGRGWTVTEAVKFVRTRTHLKRNPDAR